MKAILWSHGWGFDRHFFLPLSRLFPEVHHEFIDWGYFSEPSIPSKLDHQFEWIGVGHSLGFLKLLKLGLPFQKYISICGFPSFLNAGLEDKSLRLLENLMEKSPKKALETFYKWCGAEDLVPLSTVNDVALKKGLKELRTLDGFSEINSLTKPLLVLSGTQDRVAPLIMSHNSFPSSKMIKKVAISGQSHMFGNNGLEDCSQEIRRFMNDNPDH